MKNLITTELGGQPVYYKDFEFIQEMIRELSSAAFGANDPTKVTVLNSLVYDLSTDGYTIDVITAGWAYYLGEMFYIPVQSATGATPNILKWVINEANDPRGLKTFKDETVGDKNVYKVRTLKLEYLPTTNPNPNFSDTIHPVTTYPWTDAILETPWIASPPSGLIRRPGLKYRINKSGELELIGAIRAENAFFSGSIVTILPEAYRPEYREYIRIGHVDYSPFTAYLEATGELVFINFVDLTGVEPPVYTNLYNSFDDIFFNNKIILNTNG